MRQFVIQRKAAAILLLAVSGWSRAQPGGVSECQAADGGGARLVNASWTPASIPWSTGRVAEVNDPALNETAFRIKVPAGWKFAGALLRPRGCHAPSVPADGLSFTVLGPDGFTAVGLLPGTSWAWSSDGKVLGACKPIDIDTAAGFLLNIAVPNIHPDATIVRVLPPTPKLQQALAAANKGAIATQGFHRLLDAARVRIEYKVGDQVMEEMLYALLDCGVSAFPAYPAMHRAAMQRRNCSVHGTGFAHAPKGQLDALEASGGAQPQIDQQWNQQIIQQMKSAFAQMQQASDAQFHAIQQHFAQQHEAMMQRGRDFQDSQRQSFEHAMAADRANQAAIDHASHLQVLDSLNRQDVIDPTSGKKLEISNQFTHNWVSADGTTVASSNDANFNPNGLIDPVRQSWTELVPAN